MDSTTVIIAAIIVAIGLVAAAGLIVYMRRRRTHELKSKFGPEYLRAVDESKNAREAEARLERREKRVRSYAIHPLAAEARARFRERWREVQGEFVDSPKSAVKRADDLLGEVMQAKGYPIGDFEQQSADLSVDHPIVVQEYRAAHEIAIREQQGEAGTEDLRQAMIHYRTLFDELANDNPTSVRAAE